MKVYVLAQGWEHEGEDVVTVHASMEGAQREAQTRDGEQVLTWDEFDWGWRACSEASSSQWTICPHEVRP